MSTNFETHSTVNAQMPNDPVIVMVAGEVSGDILGAGLMRSLKARIPRAKFVGIGGEQMLAQGLESVYPMERLAVMGIVPILLRYAELHKLRKRLIQQWSERQPMVFIGIDAPEFNTGLELKLRQAGVRTVHYVSPSVWAWRQNRIHTIAKAVDLMLTLLPFEAEFYHQHNVPVEFVGHPLANMIDLDINMSAKREAFGFSLQDEVLAVLPGSRSSELKHIAPIYVRLMQVLQQRKPGIKFIVPLVNEQRRQQFMAIYERVCDEFHSTEHAALNMTVTVGNSRDVMAAANAVLLASGTATLEAMLLKKPMVVGFKWSALTHAIIAPFVKVKNVSLPNLLSSSPLVEEFIQQDCTVDNLEKAVLKSLDNSHGEHLKAAFNDIHLQLRQNADEKAAVAVCALCGIDQA